NIIYSNELNHRLKDSILVFIKLFAKSPDIGAINVIYPALDPNIDEGGKYFEECEEAKPIDQALDKDLAKKFWEKSEELLNNYDASLL
ncbi:10495_t:CDS:2, partial [Dentiscutata heterogama]